MRHCLRSKLKHSLLTSKYVGIEARKLIKMSVFEPPLRRSHSQMNHLECEPSSLHRYPCAGYDDPHPEIVMLPLIWVRMPTPMPSLRSVSLRDVFKRGNRYITKFLSYDDFFHVQSGLFFSHLCLFLFFVSFGPDHESHKQSGFHQPLQRRCFRRALFMCMHGLGSVHRLLLRLYLPSSRPY